MGIVKMKLVPKYEHIDIYSVCENQNYPFKQVWGILETRDQNYRSNARPRLRLADLLTEVVILQLRRGSER